MKKTIDMDRCDTPIVSKEDLEKINLIERGAWVNIKHLTLVRKNSLTCKAFDQGEKMKVAKVTYNVNVGCAYSERNTVLDGEQCDGFNIYFTKFGSNGLFNCLPLTSVKQMKSIIEFVGLQVTAKAIKNT